MRRTFIASLAMFISALTFAGPQDSVGTKAKNGLLFIIHKVDAGQGLYAISRRYNVALNDIVAENPGVDKQLNKDQLIYIPTGKKAPLEQKVVVDYFSSDNKEKGSEKEEIIQTRSTFAKHHVVSQGETLFSIAQTYKTKVDVIKSLNDLKTNELSVGQKLLVPISDAEKKAREKNIDDKQKNIEKVSKEANDVSKKIEEINVPKKTNDPVQQLPTGGSEIYQTKTEFIKEFDVTKVWEQGYASLYKSDELNQNKKLASHHAAEIGTTIMVTNPTTNEAVFVKVVANHKLDPEKANVVILTKAAAEKINLEESGIVEISFAR
jgi:LysM repeat protein